MSPTMEVSCRVDYRAIGTGLAEAHTSRVASLSVYRCTIRGHQIPDGEALELRIYLPDGQWPLRIDRATSRGGTGTGLRWTLWTCRPPNKAAWRPISRPKACFRQQRVRQQHQNEQGGERDATLQ